MAEPELATWVECQGFCGPWEPGQSATTGAGVAHGGALTSCRGARHLQQVLLACRELELRSWDRSSSGGQCFCGEEGSARGAGRGQREGSLRAVPGSPETTPGLDDLTRGLLGSAFRRTHGDHLSQQVTEKSWQREKPRAQGGPARTPRIFSQWSLTGRAAFPQRWGTTCVKRRLKDAHSDPAAGFSLGVGPGEWVPGVNLIIHIPYQGTAGTVLNFEFPDASRGPASQAGPSKAASEAPY